MVGAISTPDPMALPNEYAAQFPGGNRSTQGKTLRDPRTLPAATTGVFIIAGQSNACNITPSASTLSHGANIHNLNVYDGGLYSGADPLIGCQNVPTRGPGNVFTRMADKLITDGKYTNVVLIPIAIGATTVHSWVADITLNQKIIVAARRAAAINLPVKAFLWMQGEIDNANGTSQVSYAADLASVIAIPRNAGFSAPWLIGKCTWNLGTSSAAVQAAQAGIINGTTIFAGANTDSLTGTAVNRQADNTHLSDAGAVSAGNLWAAAIEAAL